MSSPFPKPEPPAPVDDEVELLLRFLGWKRAQVAATADGLDETQLRWTPDGGGLLPIIGIVHHLAHVEWRWIEGRYLARPFPPRGPEFEVPLDRTGAEVLAAYHEQAARTDDIVRAAPGLDEPCLGVEGDGPPLHELFGAARPVTLRYAVLHLLDETSQHAGHADATRELLDGTRMSR